MLTAQQQRFVAELLKDPARNRRKAAIAAGYSEKSAESQGSRLCRNAEIAAKLDAKLVKVLDKLDTQHHDVLAELSNLGFVDVTEVFNEDGTLKHPTTMRPEVRRAIKSLEFEELWEGNKKDDESGESAGRFVIGRIVKISFWDKTKSLELLGKNQKLFTEKLQIEAGPSLEALILASMAKGLP